MKNLSLGHCLVGKNLNLLVVRGFANLSDLAYISQPDEYDQLANDEGIQRSPALKHAREAMEYALESLNVVPVEDPRAFPEIILNVRDLSVLEIESQNGFLPLSLDAGTFPEVETQIVKISIRLDQLDTSDLRTEPPQISRVDGNHRLLQASRLRASGEVPKSSFPLVPFAIFIGLNSDQERKIFSDINGNHKGMNSSLLIAFRAGASRNALVEASRDERAGWLAERLTRTGFVFEGLVNKGGSLAGYKYLYNRTPRLTLVGIRNPIKNLLQYGNFWARETEGEIELQLTWIDDFFKQVRDVFPYEWDSDHDYIILKSLGLGAFSMLAGTLFNNFGKDYQKGIVERSLQILSKNMDFGRFKWAGVSGQGGMTVIYRAMCDQLAQNGLGEFLLRIPNSPK